MKQTLKNIFLHVSLILVYFMCIMSLPQHKSHFEFVTLDSQKVLVYSFKVDSQTNIHAFHTVLAPVTPPTSVALDNG